MGRGAFKSDKRKKELMRLKKQEEKRQRRFKKDSAAEEKPETESPQEAEGGSETPEANTSS